MKKAFSYLPIMIEPHLQAFELLAVLSLLAVGHRLNFLVALFHFHSPAGCYRSFDNQTYAWRPISQPPWLANFQFSTGLNAAVLQAKQRNENTNMN